MRGKSEMQMAAINRNTGLMVNRGTDVTRYTLVSQATDPLGDGVDGSTLFDSASTSDPTRNSFFLSSDDPSPDGRIFIFFNCFLCFSRDKSYDTECGKTLPTVAAVDHTINIKEITRGEMMNGVKNES